MHVFRVKVVLSLLLHYFKNNVKTYFFLILVFQMRLCNCNLCMYAQTNVLDLHDKRSMSIEDSNAEMNASDQENGPITL